MPGPPVEATTFASLPPEIRRLILQNGDIMGEADFFICTANRHGDDPAMPMQGISHESDLVVRGYYVGGMLYVTKIYGLREMDNVAGFQPEEPHPEARLFATSQVFDRAHAGAAIAPGGAVYSQLARASLGPKAAASAASEWYNEIHREDNGKIKWFKPGNTFGTLTPWVQSVDLVEASPFRVGADGNRKALPCGHRFYADRKTRKLFLSLTSDEDRLLSLRHDASSLRPVANAPWVPENPREWNRLQTRMRWREEDIRDCEASILHPIPNGRANPKAGHAGTDLLLGLSKDIMIRTDSPIIATIPILSRIAPPQPDDELLNHSAVSAQLKTPSDKWLACVPADWIYRFQQGAKDVDWAEGMNNSRSVELNSCMDHCERHLPLIGSTPDRITQLIMNNQYKMRPEQLKNERGGPRRIARPKLRLSKRGAAPSVGIGNLHSTARRKAAAHCMQQTSFDEIGPLLVACFIAQGTPARDLQCEKTLKELMALCKDPRFVSEYAVEGPHVRPTPDGAMVRPREPLDETSAQSAPVSELFDIFGGEAVLV